MRFAYLMHDYMFNVNMASGVHFKFNAINMTNHNRAFPVVGSSSLFSAGS